MVAGGPEEDGPSGSILRDVERYYSTRVRRHGPSPLGVDWNSLMSQRLRFVQLLKVVDWNVAPLSLHDLGCGYGALLEHLQDRHRDAEVQYMGSDLSVEMIKHANRLWASHGRAQFDITTSPLPLADYTVASGIFNVCLGYSIADWEDHVTETIAQMHASSCRGFAVNFMTQRTLFERPATANQLYATEPDRWIAYCAKQLNCKIRCVQDYGLNEFTLLATHSAS